MFVSGGTTSSWHQHVRSGATAATVPLLSLLGESPHTVAHALFGSALARQTAWTRSNPYVALRSKAWADHEGPVTGTIDSLNWPPLARLRGEPSIIRAQAHAQTTYVLVIDCMLLSGSRFTSIRRVEKKKHAWEK